jgi:hypothetical protein
MQDIQLRDHSFATAGRVHSPRVCADLNHLFQKTIGSGAMKSKSHNQRYSHQADHVRELLRW